MSTETHSPPQPRLLVPALAPLYEALAPLAWPLVRATAGLMLMPHGAQKLFGAFGGGGIAGTGQYLTQQLGLEPGWLFALLAGGTEFFGGLALVLGLLTRPAALAVLVLMLVAVFGVHLPNGFFWFAGGFEYPVFWGLIALAIALKGGGHLSLDRAIGREF